MMRRLGNTICELIAWIYTAPRFWNVRTDTHVCRFANDTAECDER